MTGMILGTSKEKLYQVLGLKSPENRRWFKILCYLFKISKSNSPGYLCNITQQRTSPYVSRKIDAVPLFGTRYSYYKSWFYSSSTIEGNNLYQDLGKAKLIPFENCRPSLNNFFNCQRIMGKKCVTSASLGLKFKPFAKSIDLLLVGAG